MRAWPRRTAASALLLCAWMLAAVLGCGADPAEFSGQRAYAHVERLMELGPRPVGSEANRQAAEYIRSVLERNGWEVEVQEFAHRGVVVRNVIGKRGQGPLVILGTHYDTRPVADRDPVDRSAAVPGANDGGSGVGVLLELSRVLDARVFADTEVWLAFFDAEDRGDLAGWGWSVGAQHTADTLRARPEYVLIVDMVGDTDQQFYYEWSSSLWLLERVWAVAHELGYEQQFIPEHRYTVIDDHTPFLQWGIPAGLIIDLDYLYWHTREDTLDKISAESLHRVGHVLQTVLEADPLMGQAMAE